MTLLLLLMLLVSSNTNDLYVPLSSGTSELVLPKETRHNNALFSPKELKTDAFNINVPSAGTSAYTPIKKPINAPVTGGSMGASGIPTASAPSSFRTYTISSQASAAVQAPFAAKQYNCPICGGDGYINDNGDGELEYATWYFYSSGKGDGSSCTNTTGYHDECDEETYGGVQHHFAKRKCPKCNGTGKVNSTSTSLPFGWTSWTGNAFSHPFSDSDGNGHCDEHWYHTPIGNGYAVLILMALFYCLFILVKEEVKEENM